MTDDYMLAIPSIWPGGVLAATATGLTDCECFTLVSIRGTEVQSAMILPNPPVCETGCRRHIDVLKSFRIRVLAVADIGCWALKQLQEAGIEVVRDDNMTVNAAVRSHLRGGAQLHRLPETCHEEPAGNRTQPCPEKRCDSVPHCPCPNTHT